MFLCFSSVTGIKSNLNYPSPLNIFYSRAAAAEQYPREPARQRFPKSLDILTCSILCNVQFIYSWFPRKPFFNKSLIAVARKRYLCSSAPRIDIRVCYNIILARERVQHHVGENSNNSHSDGVLHHLLFLSPFKQPLCTGNVLLRPHDIIPTAQRSLPVARIRVKAAIIVVFYYTTWIFQLTVLSRFNSIVFFFFSFPIEFHDSSPIEIPLNTRR